MVGQRIRYYRKTKGLTQEELAQGICSVSYLSKIEKGDAKSSEEVINMLCDRLGISPEEVDAGKILEMLNEWNMMMVNRQFEEAAKEYLEIKERMKGVSEPNLLLRYRLFKARYYLVQEETNLNNARIELDEVKHLFEQLPHDLKFYYYKFEGMYHSFIKQYQQALTYFNKADNQFNQAINISEIEAAIVYYLIALTHNFLLRITSVANYSFKAISIFDREYCYSRSADCQILLGLSYRRARNYEKAEYHLKLALKYSTLFKDDTTSGIIYHNLGYVAACNNEHKKAIERYKKSLIYKESQSVQNTASTLYLLATEYYNLGEIEKARELIVTGLSYVDEDNEVYYHLKILEYKLEGLDNPELPIFLSKFAIPYFHEKGILEYEATFSELLADIYFDQGLYKKASQYYRIANNARKYIF
ncbi:tetratricopeptide repeat protein [Fictibacillus phosphorivorans]|uniref:tetratricopeptide repeat protein n=1 Tax=Fictibacillus phosphorivorans TaxID=1221500 RepID=UPI002041F8BE|nr:tetratricopeptide repeat protein [Fictibacillus phosphorivorans]MCM3719401.1 helix-turn-helix domain-containing protein [Fictibacillus phosphorivorans]MCM3777121.1 helix-turn-helix domain-containing protein [Fictibacillus phosphorivorans]